MILKGKDEENEDDGNNEEKKSLLYVESNREDVCSLKRKNILNS